jgi:hypothetical protein
MHREVSIFKQMKFEIGFKNGKSQNRRLYPLSRQKNRLQSVSARVRKFVADPIILNKKSTFAPSLHSGLFDEKVCNINSEVLTIELSFFTNQFLLKIEVLYYFKIKQINKKCSIHDEWLFFQVSKTFQVQIGGL